MQEVDVWRLKTDVEAYVQQCTLLADDDLLIVEIVVEKFVRGNTTTVTISAAKQ